MPPVSVLLKPASGRCNMRCSYCFYADEMTHREVPMFDMMSDATMESLIKKTLEYAEDRCDFGFQGGEPTLAGLDFFRRFADLCDRYNTKNVRISFALQTNGLLIDEQWVRFFRERNFLIGLSLDGPAQIHDWNRFDTGNHSVFNRVMKTAERLKAGKVDFNTLTVVTRQTARHIQKVYSFFMKNGLLYQQYIPCLDPIGQPRGEMPYSLRPAEYGKFLCTLFDLWLSDRLAGRFVYIRYFENLAGMIQGHAPESCEMCGHCTAQYVAEADGSMYPCDFYMTDEYRIGNISTDSFADLEQSPKRIQFVNQSLPVSADCRSCSYARICHGGCRRNRQEDFTGAVGKNYFCEAYKTFFDYALPRLNAYVRDAR